MQRAAHSQGSKCAVNLIFGLLMIVDLPFHISFVHLLSSLSVIPSALSLCLLCSSFLFSSCLSSVTLSPRSCLHPSPVLPCFFIALSVFDSLSFCVCQEPYLQAMCDCCSYRLDPQTPVRFLSLHCSSGENEPVVLPVIQSCECTSCQGRYRHSKATQALSQWLKNCMHQTIGIRTSLIN